MGVIIFIIVCAGRVFFVKQQKRPFWTFENKFSFGYFNGKIETVTWMTNQPFAMECFKLSKKDYEKFWKDASILKTVYYKGNIFTADEPEYAEIHENSPAFHTFKALQAKYNVGIFFDKESDYGGIFVFNDNGCLFYELESGW